MGSINLVGCLLVDVHFRTPHDKKSSNWPILVPVPVTSRGFFRCPMDASARFSAGEFYSWPQGRFWGIPQIVLFFRHISASTFAGTTKLDQYVHVQLAVQNRESRHRKLLTRYPSTSANVRVSLPGKSGIDCFRMASVPMTISQV